MNIEEGLKSVMEHIGHLFCKENRYQVISSRQPPGPELVLWPSGRVGLVRSRLATCLLFMLLPTTTDILQSERIVSILPFVR